MRATPPKMDGAGPTVGTYETLVGRRFTRLSYLHGT